MNKNGINCVFHYVPLHSAEGGLKYGRFFGRDVYTTKESERLLRLPMYFELSVEDKKKVIDYLKRYFYD